MSLSPARMAEYRAGPLASEVHRWSSRTINQARRELARRHRGEYARILAEVRERDPRPAQAAATEETRNAA